ncbi:hypothetical protein [Aminipila sp.]|uniref:hypothetical protein n=1 Tax=Aminipila sp. TaxID=2060095 RepID=UPI002899014E|nr:hypothetical protein [Aminipila sp.]
MNIGYLRQIISSIAEIQPLGRTAEISGIIYHIIGLIRYNHALRIVALHYDKEFAQQAEIVEITESNGCQPRTNRELLRGDSSVRMTNIFHTVEIISIGEKQFTIDGTETMPCDLQNWEIPVIFTEFFKRGWNPDGIEYQSIENLFLTTAEISGEYDCIPDFGENPVLRLTFRCEPKPYWVEQPVTLLIGTEYPDKLYFQDKDLSANHWVQINQVYLLDIWEETMKSFDDPLLAEQFAASERNKHKADFERHFTAICPKDMCFLVIEYECEEDISLRFQSREWLNATIQDNISCMGFLIKPEKKTGILGLPLKTSIMAEPISKNCVIIDTELVFYSILQKYDDVLL